MSIESAQPNFDNLSWEERQYYNLRIFEVFDEKNYNSVNMSECDFLSMSPHLNMYAGEAKKLASELAVKGYDVEIITDPLNKFKAIAIISKDGVCIHPASLIDVFKTLPGMGCKK